MNVFIFFFLTTAMVTAEPHTASTLDKHQHKSGKPVNSTNHKCHQKLEERVPLKEIISDVKNLKRNLTEKILWKEVQNVFMNAECNRKTLCKAGEILSAYNASDLGLNRKRDWRLPRRLRAYSKLQNCTNTGKLDNVPLHQLLDKIHNCTQKEFAKPCKY